MINLNEIKSLSIINRLKDYKGLNPYITYLKNQYVQKNIKLTESQVDYVRNFSDKDPIELNNVVEITQFLSDELQKKYDLKHPPSKILVEYYLAETDKAYHVLGKLYRNQEDSKLLWIPKTQLNDDIFFKKTTVEVDFEKYDKMNKLGRKLFDHQKEGVKFLLERKKCILADDMGIGKSVVGVVSALELGAKSVLIICPASLKLNWKKELSNFCDENDIFVAKSAMEWEPKKFTIINYDILKNYHTIVDSRKKVKKGSHINTDIIDHKFDLIIVDEAHMVKNSGSIRAKILLDVKKHLNPSNIWLLTGTPISNRPSDYYNLLNLIDSAVASNWQFFVKRYCDGRQIRNKQTGKKFWLTTGSSNLDELNIRTKNIILRRLKDDVLDLPDKIKIPVYFELENKVEYDKVYENYLLWRKLNGKGSNVARQLVELTLLRKFLAIEKTKHCIDLIHQFLENGKKIIVFTNYTEELEIIQEEFKNISVSIHGATKSDDRQKYVDRFQEDDKIRLFIGQIKAAGVGFTLTSADTVIINSLDWVPGNIEQAEDRAYRISQTKNVNIYYLLFDNTVDTLVWNTLEKKRNIIDKIINNQDFESNDDLPIFEEILNKIDDKL